MRLKTILVSLSLAAALTACNGDYLVDGGTSEPNYDGTIMQFLESRPDLFEDLVTVVRLTSWKDVFSNPDVKVTFFAPTDFAIEAAMTYVNYYLYNYEGVKPLTDLSQIKASVWEDLIGMYVMEDTYRLNDIAQIDTVALSAYPGQTNRTYDQKFKMTMGVCYHDAGGIKYVGYRQILYSYPDMAHPVYAYVATCNIEPSNGVIHVLRIDHTLGFDRTALLQQAIEAGISTK